MPKPEAREQGAPIQYFTASKPSKKDKGNWARQNQNAYNKATEQILLWHAQYARDTGAPPPNYAMGTNIPAPPKEEFVPSKPEKKSKKKTPTIDESKPDTTEKGKTEALKQKKDLTNQIVDQLKKDMNSGDVVQSNALNPGGKEKNWWQRNVADSFVGKAARSVRDSAVGDVTGKVLDYLSRPEQGFAAFIQSAYENGLYTSADPMSNAGPTPDPRKQKDFKTWTPEQQKTAVAAYESIKQDAGTNPFKEGWRAFTGQKPASFTEQYNKQELARRGKETTAGRVAATAAGLSTDVTVDPLNALGAGIATMNKVRKVGRTADEVITAADETSKATAATRRAVEEITAAREAAAPRNLPVLASEANRLPVTAQLEANVAEQSRRIAELDAAQVARANKAADLRSASEGGYKALVTETKKQARILANMERGGKAEPSAIEAARASLENLHARVARVDEIRNASRTLPVGEKVAAAQKKVDDLARIAKTSSGEAKTIATQRLLAARKDLKAVTAAEQASNLTARSAEILNAVEKLNAGEKVPLTEKFVQAVTESDPSLQDQLLALMRENEKQFTKTDEARDSAKLAGAIEGADLAKEPPTPSGITLDEAKSIVESHNTDRSARDIAQSILDDAAERGRTITPGEQRGLLSRQLLDKLGETGVQGRAAERTAEKIKAVRAREGALAVNADLRKALLQESAVEEILPTMKTADEILSEGLNKRFAIRFAGKDLGEFRPIGSALRAAYAPFEFTGRHLAETRGGEIFQKAFKMGAHFPGYTDEVRRAAESNGIVTHSDFTKRIRNAFEGISRDEAQQIRKAIEGGYPLSGRLEELRQFAMAESKQIFENQVKIGKYPPSAFKDDYVYHYYRSRNSPKIKLFKDDRTALLRAGKKGPTIDAAKAAGLKPVDGIDDILVMQHRDYVRDLQRTNFRNGIVSNYGVLTDNKSFADQMGLVPVKNAALNKPFQDLATAKGAQWYLPPEVNDTFKAMDAMMEIGFNRQANEALEFLDRFTRAFKTSATVGNPGNWVNNTLGDVFLNWVDGVRNPKWYSDAVKLLRLDPESEIPKVMKIGGHEMSGVDIVDIFKRKAPSGGFIRTEGTALGRNRFVRGGQNLYEAREEGVRLAHFLHAFDEEARALPKSMAWERRVDIASEKAARRVAKWNIDYSAITPFERSLRKWVIPFYTFMRKATPLMFEGMVTRPGKFAHYDMAKRAVETMLGAPHPGDDGVTWPFWALQAGMVRLQGGDQPYFMKDPAPLNVVNRLLGGDQYTDPLSNVVNQVNPLIKMPIEISQQKTLFNQQPIKNWGAYFAGQLPTAQILSRAAGADLNPGETKTPDRSVFEQIANFSGFPVQRMTFNRQRGEIYRQTKNGDYKKQINSQIAPYFEISAAHSKTKGDYFNIKDLQTGEIIAKFRDYNMAARRASTLAREAARRAPQTP